MKEKVNKNSRENKGFLNFKNLPLFLKKSLVEARKKTVFLVIVFLLSAFAVLFSVKYFTKGASFDWIQTDWSGGATANTASHENNRSGWDEYANKSEDIDASVSGEISTQNTNAEELIYTTDEDFGNGAVDGIDISNNEMTLLEGGSGT